MLDRVLKTLCKDAIQVYVPFHLGVLLIKQDVEGLVDYVCELISIAQKGEF